MNEPSKSTQEETELINLIKSEGEELQLMILNLEASGVADPHWLDIARTQLQLGLVAAVRAVAKTNTF